MGEVLFPPSRLPEHHCRCKCHEAAGEEAEAGTYRDRRERGATPLVTKEERQPRGGQPRGAHRPPKQPPQSPSASSALVPIAANRGEAGGGGRWLLWPARAAFATLRRGWAAAIGEALPRLTPPRPCREARGPVGKAGCFLG